ncbi:MAG: acyclic terpene utilization AtuA family protein, partial [Terracidiphilus sp.]
LGLAGLRIAWVEGDDVLDRLPAGLAETLALDPREKLVSANAYLGVEPLLECLRQQPDVILTGRVADPSLFLAPIVHEFGWSLDDWNSLGQGTAVGHLLECAGQLTGGYFADPGFKDVPDLASLGFPLAEVEESGEAVLTKLQGAGGALTVDTCKEQILYEVHDPSRYLTPDVTADFTGIRFTPLAPDRIRVSGARGAERPATLKVSVGLYTGFIAEGQISYAGPGALSRASLARDILASRLGWIPAANLHIGFIGLNSIHGEALSTPSCEPYEVRLRAAARLFDEPDARKLTREVESLYVNGPAGGGGVTTSIRENIAMETAFIARASVTPTIGWEVA